MNSTLNFAGLVNSILGIANTLIPILIAVAMVGFFIGLIRYIYNSGSSHDHEQGREIIQWGLIAMFLLVCIWGIVDFIRVALLGS